MELSSHSDSTLPSALESQAFRLYSFAFLDHFGVKSELAAKLCGFALIVEPLTQMLCRGKFAVNKIVKKTK